jgi:hypothetical protein
MSYIEDWVAWHLLLWEGLKNPLIWIILLEIIIGVYPVDKVRVLSYG